ncbi:ImmA/IrrE family metallo-endopeptidase [Cryobacterium sp. 10S3]|uniref:ImmA/IrrE family metallo-endopeptidase n=1 Tax=unclassified Cryobacterium TaxID=2649013 RepID=UPI002AC97271|nr:MULTISPECIES: ImmA/IrrE family metallo-endopeptidase [unclassified Cryobacterium]MEB0001686.1 ImmA/IrrE family metallo-endopeptidase [Cryobacterium sp. RTC2.1]MEB0286718.1 ImmA/IrrE family metallo-endopeptidase [Cryobacterium sp. 10S3]WPX15763.1 ImmA/IrrE family metallo-endopeptidase [Cryobacterium sp. 10S3]
MRWIQKEMRALASEERAQLGLGPLDPFDPYALCDGHGVPVYTLTDFRHLVPDAIEHLAVSNTSKWSAALVPLGTARFIIENDKHVPARRRSSIAHELGHLLLEHEFTGVVLGDHSGQYGNQQEKEADFLAGELLVPFAAVEKMAFAKWGNKEVAEAYMVSEQFAQNQMKGQRVRAARAEAKFRRP